MEVAVMLKSITIEIPIDVVSGELGALFETPRSLQLMKDMLPDYGSNHRILGIDRPTRIVFSDGGLVATVDLARVGDLTEVTIRIPHRHSDKQAAALSMFAQLCAFESLEQGYKAGFKSRMSRQKHRR